MFTYFEKIVFVLIEIKFSRLSVLNSESFLICAND